MLELLDFETQWPRSCPAKEEAIRAEDVAIPAGDAPGQLPVIDLEGLGDLATEARAEADEAVGVLGQHGAGLDLAVELAGQRRHELLAQETFDVTFNGFGGQPVKGWLILPSQRTGITPCVVEYIGYGGGRAFAMQTVGAPDLFRRLAALLGPPDIRDDVRFAAQVTVRADGKNTRGLLRFHFGGRPEFQRLSESDTSHYPHSLLTRSDEFVEVLCGDSRTRYRYKGRCRTMACSMVSGRSTSTPSSVPPRASAA